MVHNDHTDTSFAGRATQQQRPLEIVTAGLLLASVVIAVLQPAWLTVPLRSTVELAGDAAPIMFVLLCAVAAPFHLNGVLVALSALLWPLPIAGALSFTGSIIGCLFTAALLSRLSGAALGRWANGSTILRRLSVQVARRPLLIGLLARVAIGSGLALEAFYLLTGYTRRHYLLTTTIGVAVWVGQALVGVTLLHELSQQSPWLAVVVSIAGPLLTGWAAFGLYKRRASGLTER